MISAARVRVCGGRVCVCVLIIGAGDSWQNAAWASTGGTGSMVGSVAASPPLRVIVCSGVEASAAAWLTLVSIHLARDH